VLQASPAVQVASLVELETASESALPWGALLRANALWSRASAYYFCNVARMQRLWQVSHILCNCVAGVYSLSSVPRSLGADFKE
jgi:hypothetical protein